MFFNSLAVIRVEKIYIFIVYVFAILQISSDIKRIL